MTDRTFPWRVERDEKGWFDIRSAGGAHIAYSYGNEEIDRLSALAMAAAPELLEALEECAVALDKVGCNALAGKAFRTIAKARGRECSA